VASVCCPVPSSVVAMVLDMMSIQSQLELNDIQESANEPGPGHYFGPESIGFSSLGKQKFGKCRSAPEISLPKTGWENWEKIIVSSAHARSGAGKCRTSAGAKYEILSGLEQNGAKIGTSLRPDLSASLGVDPNGSPGPTINLRDGPAAQIGEAPPHKARENKSFGCANRFPTDTRNAGLGPGQYQRKDSAIQTGNGRSIGTGRQSWEKVITLGWESEGRCRASPGVGPPRWTDILKEGSKGQPIPKAERFPKSSYSTCSPGPVYNQEERSVSRPKQFISDTRTVSTNSFSKPPKKPRFRLMLATNCAGAKHGMWGYH